MTGRRRRRGTRGRRRAGAVPRLTRLGADATRANRRDETIEVPDHLLTALAPFLDSGDLGELVRRRMRPQAPKSPPAPPERSESATVVPTPDAPDFRTVVAAEAPVTVESLAGELRRPDLTVEERQRIAMRLADLSYEQSVRAIES